MDGTGGGSPTCRRHQTLAPVTPTERHFAAFALAAPRPGLGEGRASPGPEGPGFFLAARASIASADNLER
jgi:hypothetical protein